MNQETPPLRIAYVPETRALRIAYVRLLQAVLALHLEMLEDAELGGGMHLQKIVDAVNAARSDIERLAVAEGIDLGLENE